MGERVTQPEAQGKYWGENRAERTCGTVWGALTRAVGLQEERQKGTGGARRNDIHTPTPDLAIKEAQRTPGRMDGKRVEQECQCQGAEVSKTENLNRLERETCDFPKSDGTDDN